MTTTSAQRPPTASAGSGLPPHARAGSEESPLSEAGARQREQRLLRRYRDGDLSAREELIAAFAPLARRLAGRYRNAGEAREDLEQVAYLGLIKAIDRFDPELGPFVRYAVPNILGELKRHFRDKGWAIRVPRSLQERVLQVGDALDELSGQLGRSPTPRDIATHLELSVEQVLEALDTSSAYTPVTLDAPRPGDPEGERTLGEGLGSDDERFELVELGGSVAPALRALPARERAILKLRFVDDLTQAEIAEQVGVSQMHVSRLLRRSLERLSAAVDGDAGSAGSPRRRRSSRCRPRAGGAG